jgi:hypothetical protein
MNISLLHPVSSCCVPVLGLFVVGVTNWPGEGIEPRSLSMNVQFVNPCDGCPPLPFIDARGRGKKGKQKKSYSAWPLRCPLECRCPSGHIEEELRHVIVEVAASPGGAIYFMTPGASSE